MLRKIFGSRIRAKLLGWFLTHPDESYFVRQLASILKEDPTNTSRELSKLETLGILTSLRERNLKRFQVNRECPFYAEIKGLVFKTIGLLGQLKAAIDNISGAKIAFVYGSYARGEENATSDMDLLIVGEVDIDELDEMIVDLEKKMGRTVNYVLYDKDEFNAKRRAKDGFLMDVLKGEKIWLVGTEDGLKKI